MAQQRSQEAVPANPVVNLQATTQRDPHQLDSVLEHVRQALAGLQFGQVSVVVQDGVVVQVERVERKRFRRGER